MSLYLIAHDKANHIAYGALSASLGGTTAEIALLLMPELGLWLPPATALACGIAAGWVKDKYIDLTFNWDDFWNTVIGALFPTMPLSIPFFASLFVQAKV